MHALEQPRQNMDTRFRRTDQVVVGGVLVFLVVLGRTNVLLEPGLGLLKTRQRDAFIDLSELADGILFQVLEALDLCS